ncbi:hypothetical protein M622_11820 [Thauera terpenica 58Eu]|uniref:carbonic anhydrase n=1 Tax=Thauera terpenica 58Eu TaxID=1348657 RepID=S9ZSW3_9RHOO|nr:carbonic anhydrase family protein [Thauera terpenica]EPZ16592.1 hypothetical protein M622_11820 [Thauera terpenica 58Eu]
MKPSRLVLLAMLTAIPLQQALAADWQLVLSDRNRRVEIDRSSIFASDRGTKVSWGRVVLSNEEAATAGYATIKALNRYDCQNRTFVTVKRVYLDGNEIIVREESVAEQAPLRVTPNSVDERMWREVCTPPSANDLQRIASEVQKLAATQPALAQPVVAPPVPLAPAPSAKAALPAAEAEPEGGAKALPASAEDARPGPIDARDTSVRPIRAAQSPQPAPAAQSRAEPQTATPEATPQASIVPPLPRIKPTRPEPEAAEAADAPTKGSAPPPRARVTPARAASSARKPNVPPVLAMAQTRTPSRSGPAPLKPGANAAAPDAPDAVEALLRARRQNPFDAGWSYEGETGPEVWGRLRPDWRTCSEGRRQSPVDLREGLVVDLAPIKFHYLSTGFRIRDTGNAIEVTPGEGMGMEVRGVRYELERLSLHQPAQERIGGMAFDMSMYLEHRSADGRIAILAVLLSAGTEPNVLLQTLLNNLPLDQGREFVPDAIIDLADILPDNPAHFLYLGSLPTPPCTEDVIWAVMKTPVGMSADQLAVFARLHTGNSRPLQDTNGRPILESR